MVNKPWKDWLLLNPGKWLFSVIFAFNTGWFLAEKPHLLPNLLIYFFFPFICIWFADAFGQYVRFSNSMKKAVRISLPTFIQYVGWILLIIPFVWVVLWNR